MKKMKRILFIFSVCMAALSWSGCSDDDDSVNPSLLVGKWECYKDYDEEYDVWDDEYGEGIDVYRYIFREDGTGACRTDEHKDLWVELTYRLDGNMLAIVDEREPDYEERIRIESLTSTELVFAYDYVSENDGRKYTDKEYFRRIE